MGSRSRLRAQVLAVVLALAACRLIGAAPDPRERLAAELDGVIPANAPREQGVREVAIEAARAEIPLFPGEKPLRVWAYDGRVPGPTIRVRLGERLRVTFKNRLPEETTIHWHGVRVPNAMDGVPHVTQPPVAPGESFVYEFVPKDAGTYWFHPHVRSSEQVERGLYGVLVVEDAEPAPYSRDVVWVLDDWRIGKDAQIDPAFNTRHDLAHDGRWGNFVTVNGRRDETLVVKAGERIRLRLVNAANGRVFIPDFAGLDARAIAVDGLYAAHAFDPNGFELSPGNRLDLDVTFRAEDRGRELAIVDRFGRRPFPLATIRVTEELVKTPEFESPAATRMPSWETAATLSPDAEWRMNARRGGRYGIEWTLNEQAFAGDHSMAPTAALRLGRFAKLRFVNESARLHPMHLHGQFFRVLTRNGAAVNEPHFRDTALLHRQETIEIGLVPFDPGPWMLHCHILEHAEAGMMTLVTVEAPSISD